MLRLILRSLRPLARCALAVAVVAIALVLWHLALGLAIPTWLVVLVVAAIVANVAGALGELVSKRQARARRTRAVQNARGDLQQLLADADRITADDPARKRPAAPDGLPDLLGALDQATEPGTDDDWHDRRWRP